MADLLEMAVGAVREWQMSSHPLWEQTIRIEAEHDPHHEGMGDRTRIRRICELLTEWDKAGKPVAQFERWAREWFRTHPRPRSR